MRARFDGSWRSMLWLLVPLGTLPGCSENEGAGGANAAFLGSPTVQASEASATPASQPQTAVPPPAPEKVEPTEPARQETPASAPEAAAAPAPTPAPAEPEVAAIPAPLPGERELAQQLLHGGRKSLTTLAGSSPRHRLWRAFALALEGDTAAARKEGAGLESAREISKSEVALLQQALSNGAAPDAGASETEIERAFRLALVERDASQALAAGEDARAAKAYSQLLRAELEGPAPADRASLARWTAAIKDVQERHRWSRKGAWPAVEVAVERGDSLIAVRKRVLAQHPELLISTGLIARANGLRDERAIRPGDKLRIPTERAWTLVDVDACWTLYMLGDEVADAWEVGVGKEAGSTRTGRFKIGEKQKEPMWFREGMPPTPYGDPQNPLGSRWLAWLQDGAKTSLGFHGTSDPAGIGGRVSQGCIRMRNEEVEVLFEILPQGAEVVVQP